MPVFLFLYKCQVSWIFMPLTGTFKKAKLNVIVHMFKVGRSKLNRINARLWELLSTKPCKGATIIAQGEEGAERPT